MTKQYIDPSKIYVWVHTWWKRDDVRKATLASLDTSDAAGLYHVHRQDESHCKVHFFIHTMRTICAMEDYDWILRLEDDTLVNKHLIHNVCTWPVPHVEPKFGMGFLSVSNPVLKDTPHIAYGEKLKTPWRNYKAMHFGGGILWNRREFQKRIRRIKKCMCRHVPHLACAVCPSQVFREDGLRSYFHVPSIVKIDLSYARHVDGKVIGEGVHGTQPFDRDFRR